jgi:hypothetical protein
MLLNGCVLGFKGNVLKKKLENWKMKFKILIGKAAH